MLAASITAKTHAHCPFARIHLAFTAQSAQRPVKLATQESVAKAVAILLLLHCYTTVPRWSDMAEGASTSVMPWSACFARSFGRDGAQFETSIRRMSFALWPAAIGAGTDIAAAGGFGQEYLLLPMAWIFPISCGKSDVLKPPRPHLTQPGAASLPGPSHGSS